MEKKLVVEIVTKMIFSDELSLSKYITQIESGSPELAELVMQAVHSKEPRVDAKDQTPTSWGYKRVIRFYKLEVV